MDTRKIIIILVAVLIAALLLGAVLFYFLPSDSATPVSPSPAPPLTDAAFNFEVLQRPEFLQLNHSFIQQGALPVPPPATIGKANPFL